MVNYRQLAFSEVRADSRVVASCSLFVERLACRDARWVGSDVPNEMVSPEALKLNEFLRDAPKAVDMDLLHQREAGEHAEDMTAEPGGSPSRAPPPWEACGPRPATGMASRRSCTRRGSKRVDKEGFSKVRRMGEGKFLQVAPFPGYNGRVGGW